MATDGSVSIALVLDRSQFDNDLKKLQGIDIPAMPVPLKIDQKDFARQIKGLEGFIEPISIPVSADLSDFKKAVANLRIDPIKVDLSPNIDDFQEKLRRLGKISPVNVDVQFNADSVKQQFREIGNLAQAGFSEGIGSDIGRDAAATIIKNVKQELDIHSPSGVFRDIGKYAIDGLMEGLDSIDESKLRGIVGKIEDYFKKTDIKVDFKVNADIAGSARIGAAIQAPRIDNQIENKLDIGKFDSELSKSIEKGFKAASKKGLIESLFGGLGAIGSGLVGMLAIPLKVAAFGIKTTFEGYGIGVGEALADGVGKGLKEGIGSSLKDSVGSAELVAVTLGEGIAEAAGATLKKLIPGSMKGVSQIAKEVIGEDKVAEARAVDRSQQQSRQKENRQVATQQIQQEYSSVVQRGLPARAKELQAQISPVLPGIERDAKQLAIEYQKVTQELQQKAQEIKVSLTPEAVVSLRKQSGQNLINRANLTADNLEKQGKTEEARRVRAAAQKLPAPSAASLDPANVSAAEIRQAEAMEQAKAQNRFISQGLQSRFGARQADIRKRSEAIAPQIAEYNRIQQELEEIGKSAQLLNVNPAKDARSKQKQSLPPIYKKVFQEVAKASGLQIPQDKIPSLAPSSNLGENINGDYDPKENTIRVRPEAYQRIHRGDIHEPDISNLVHEARHALQFNLGENDIAKGALPGVGLLSPNPEEARSLGKRIELSTKQQPEKLQSVGRKLESDAYVFEKRNAPSIIQGLQKDRSVENFQSNYGVAGAKIESLSRNAQAGSLKKVLAVRDIAATYGIDVQKEIEEAIAQSDKIAATLEPLLGKAANIQVLTTSEIAELSESIKSTFESVVAQLGEIPNQLKSSVKAKIDRPIQSEAIAPPPIQQIENPGMGLQERAKQIGEEFKQKSSEFKNQIGAAQELGDFKTVNEQIDMFVKLAAEGKKELDEIRANLIAIGQIEKSNNTNEASKSKAAITRSVQKVQSEFTKDPLATEQVKAFPFVDQVEDKYQRLKTSGVKIGQNLPNAIASGIDGGESEAIAAAKEMAESLPNIVEQVLQIKSPSKVFQAIGRFITEGLSMGIRQGTPEVVGAMELLDEETQAIRKKLNESMGIKPFSGTLEEMDKQTEEIKQKLNESMGFTPKPSTKLPTPPWELPKESKFEQIADPWDLPQSRPLPKIKPPIKRDSKFAMNSVEATKRAQQIEREIQEQAKELEEVVQESQAFFMENLGAGGVAGGSKNNVLQDILKNPIGYLKERPKSAVIQKARYLTENASGIADLVGSKVGDNPEPKQAKALLNLQDAFGNLGEKAEAFGSKKSDKNFKALNEAVKELESSLRALGIPFELINHEIDSYTGKLKKMQAEGKIDLEVDVSSLAPEKFSFIDNIAAKFSGLEIKGLKALSGLAQGFLAFHGLFMLQDALRQVTIDAFKAFTELDRMKTALDFASGGSGAGSQNLAFVKKTVDDLGIPLQASTAGFTKLAAATRNTALEGKPAKEIFTGISDASTVLSLSSEDTQASISALAEMESKGKVGAEELRLELGDRIPGAMAIAARATGKTQEEFTRMLDAGEILSDDFLPKFGKQLQAEFGESAKTASGNAASAVFGVQNAFLELQQTIGGAIAPAVVNGMNLLATTLKGIGSIAKEVAIAVATLATVMLGRMVMALRTIAMEFILTKAAGGTLMGGLNAVASMLNRSPAVMWTAGIFALLEVINLLNQAVNTELVTSFHKSAEAAREAADESRKAFEKPGKGENQGNEPESSSGVGRFIDKYAIGGLNKIPGVNLQTYGQLERDSINADTSSIAVSTEDFLGSARTRLRQLKNRTGDTGKIPGIDAQLKDAEESRQITQAEIQRNYTDKGLATPASEQRKLEGQDLAIRDLNDRRAEASKPFTLDLAKTEQQITSIKSQIESLKSPEAIKAIGGSEAALAQTQVLKASLEKLKQFKADAESALSSLRIDPLLAFTNALRQLNLAFAERQEKINIGAANDKNSIIGNQLATFGSNQYGSREANVRLADLDEQKAKAEFQNQQSLSSGLSKEISRPEFQSTLRRLGVDQGSSAAKINDALQNTKDENDKAVLEKLKASREQQNNVAQSQGAYTESRLKTKSSVQDYALFRSDESASIRAAALQNQQNLAETFVKRGQAARLISEEQAAKQLAQIQLKTTAQQRVNLQTQLADIQDRYGKGQISAEEFYKRDRDLSNQSTALEKQQAEARLSLVQAFYSERVKLDELANKKLESGSAIAQSRSTQTAKEKLLAGGLNQPAQDTFAIAQVAIEQKAAQDSIALARKKIADNKNLYQSGLIDFQTYQGQQYSLEQDMAQKSAALTDLKIQAEEKWRDVAEHAIQRVMAAEDNRAKLLESMLSSQKAALEDYSSELDRTAKLESSRANLAKAQSDAAISPLELDKSGADRSMELVRKLQDPGVDPRVANEINKQLSDNGYGKTELEILAQRAKIEDEIFAKKMAGLKQEQAAQQESLQLDLQKQKIAAENSVFDAISAQLAAKKSELEAQGALRVAQIKKDDIAAQAASIGIQIAQKQGDLADRRLANSLKSLGIEDELEKNATQAQEITQQTALDQQVAANDSRKQAESLERVEILAGKVSKTGSSSGGLANNGHYDYAGRLPGETALQAYQRSMFGTLKGESILDAQKRQMLGIWKKGVSTDDTHSGRPEAPIYGGDINKPLAPIPMTPTIDYSGYHYDPALNGQGVNNIVPKIPIPPKQDSIADQIAQKLNSTINPQELGNQFVEALKGSNKDVVDRLNVLIDKMAAIVAAPRNLTVTTPNPVDDAAKIMSDTSRMMMRNSGI